MKQNKPSPLANALKDYSTWKLDSDLSKQAKSEEVLEYEALVREERIHEAREEEYFLTHLQHEEEE